LQAAVVGLAAIWPDDPSVQRWHRAVVAWAARARHHHRTGLRSIPRTKVGPVTRFLAEVAPFLPVPLAQTILVRLLTLLAAGKTAEAPCYRLYLAARHLERESRRSAEVREALRAGRYLDAIAAMAPPSVREPEVLEAYRTALRNALGQRKPATRNGAAEPPIQPRPGAGTKAARPAPEPSTPSLCFVLAAVIDRKADVREEGDADDGLTDVPVRPGARRSGALDTNRARAIPIGLTDLDSLRFAILLKRLELSDVDARTKWTLAVVLKTEYITGWPVALLGQLGATEGAVLSPAEGVISVGGGLYAAAAKAANNGVRLTVGAEVIRLLRSVLGVDGRLMLGAGDTGRPVSTAIMRAVLGYLSADDACPTTLAMVRGAVWHTGHGLRWTLERLVLATCAWDPAFTRAFHYWHGSPVQDVRRLHDAMASRLRHGQQRLQAIQAGNGFADI